MPIPRIYTCNWTLFPVMDVIEAARFTAREKFAGMELESSRLGFWPTTVTASTLRELVSIGKNEGIEYSVHAPDCINPATDLPEMRAGDWEIFRRLVEIANHLSSSVIGIHPGVVQTLFELERHNTPFDVKRFRRDVLIAEARERAVATYVEWGDFCREAGLMLTVENEVHVRHSVAPTVEVLAELIRKTAREHIRVNLDTGHAFIGAGLSREFLVLKELIVHMHLDDGRTPGVSEHLPLGEGRADFSPLSQFIAHLQGAAVLEIYAPDRPVEATRASRDYVLRLVKEAGAFD